MVDGKRLSDKPGASAPGLRQEPRAEALGLSESLHFPSSSARRGFLLIEAMIASVVLAIAVVGIAGVLATSYAQAAVMRQNATATALARQLMEEIAALPLANPDGSEVSAPLPGHVTRAQFQTVGEYNGYADNTNAMTSIGGLSISPGDGELYSRSVTVTYETGPSGPAASSGDFALLTVSVTTPSNQIVTLSRLLAVTTWAL